jgi:hypothetical protein
MAPGDDMLRIGIRSAVLLNQVADAGPKHLSLTVSNPALMDSLAALLLPKKGNGSGSVKMQLITQMGQPVIVSLGTDYALDTSLQAQIEAVIGHDHIVCD